MFTDDRFDRRTLITTLAASAAVGASGEPALAQRRRGPPPKPAAPRVLNAALLGDSITAGYGLPHAAALPVQLEQELARIGARVRVSPFGVSGDTTGMGLSRLRTTRMTADLWIVALGGNDLLQGADPTDIRRNLDAIVDLLKARRAPGVVLAGIQAPPFFGRAYAAAFDSAFAEVARTNALPFYPNLLDGVLGVKALNQPDGIHPNREGVKIVARGLAPVIAQATAQLR